MFSHYWINGLWVVGGVNLAVGLLHLVIGLRSEAGRRRSANLWFGAGAIAYFVVIVFSERVYLAQTVETALEGFRHSVHAYLLYGFCLYGLAGAYRERQPAWIIRLSALVAAVLLTVNQLQETTLAFSGAPRLESFVLPWGERLAGVAAPTSVWLAVATLFVLGSLPYAWYIARTAAEASRRQALAVAVAISIFAAGMVADVVLVAIGAGWAPVTDLTHTALIGVLSYELIHELLTGRSAQRRLTEAESRFDELVKHSPSAVFIKDLDGTYTSVNQRFAELAGLNASEIVGRKAAEIESPAMLPTAETNDREVLDAGLPRYFEEAVTTVEGDRWMRVVKFPLRDPRGETYAIGAIATDLTDHKNAELELLGSRDRLSRLASQLSATEERERHEIATYLHDHLSQSLAALRMKIDRLGNRAGSDKRELTAQALRLIDGMIEQTRTATFNLSPPMLYDLGLEAALEWLVQSTCKTTELQGTFHTDGRQGALDTEANVLLFRCAGELINNVVKHADAGHITVGLVHDDHRVRLSIEDDGHGFGLSTLEPSTTSYGLFSIRERMRIAGGTFDIGSGASGGTRAVLTLPIPAA